MLKHLIVATTFILIFKAHAFDWLEVEVKIKPKQYVSFNKVTRELSNLNYCLTALVKERFQFSPVKTLYFVDQYLTTSEKKYDFVRLRKRYHYYPYKLLSLFQLITPHRIEIQKKGSYVWQSDGFYTALESRTEILSEDSKLKTHFSGAIKLITKRSRLNVTIGTPISWGDNPKQMFIISLDQFKINGKTYEELEVQIDRNKVYPIQKLLKENSLTKLEMKHLNDYNNCINSDFKKVAHFIKNLVGGEFIKRSKFNLIKNHTIKSL